MLLGCTKSFRKNSVSKKLSGMSLTTFTILNERILLWAIYRLISMKVINFKTTESKLVLRGFVLVIYRE